MATTIESHSCIPIRFVSIRFDCSINSLHMLVLYKHITFKSLAKTRSILAIRLVFIYFFFIFCFSNNLHTNIFTNVGKAQVVRVVISPDRLPVVFVLLYSSVHPLSLSLSFWFSLSPSSTEQIGCNSCQTETSTEFERHRRRRRQCCIWSFNIALWHCCTVALRNCCTADAVAFDTATNYFYRFGCRHKRRRRLFIIKCFPSCRNFCDVATSTSTVAAEIVAAALACVSGITNAV